jgi:CheY-like chemotaxis protein
VPLETGSFFLPVQRTLRSDQTEGVLSVREAEALWKQSFPYDVVLCDVMMPNSNGADLY